MPFEIIRDDITHSTLQAIVCPTGRDLVPRGTVSASIFTLADAHLMRECRKLGSCPEGGAVLTHSHGLSAEFIIHTALPEHPVDDTLLRSCYRACLTLAEDMSIASVAFPLMGSGSGGCSKELALRIATEEIGSFLLENEDILVQLVIYDQDALRAGQGMFQAIRSYVDEHYVSSHGIPRPSDRAALAEAMEKADATRSPLLISQPVVVQPATPREPVALCPKCQQPTRKNARFCGYCGTQLKFAQKLWPADPLPPEEALRLRLSHLSDPFSTYLLHLIDQTGKTDAEVYKKANIDRKLFSKIRSNPSYQPKKATALALAVALELNLLETQELLQRAGYALSSANQFDLIISYFIEQKKYNIFEINEALFFFHPPLLGG